MGREVVERERIREEEEEGNSVKCSRRNMCFSNSHTVFTCQNNVTRDAVCVCVCVCARMSALLVQEMGFKQASVTG